jgi:hypothetical protein
MITSKLATQAPVAALISLDDPACEAPALAGNKAATPERRLANGEEGGSSWVPLRDLDRRVPGLTRSADVGLRM